MPRLMKRLKKTSGGAILTIITRSSFLVKVELISFHGSSLSVFITKKVQLNSLHGFTISHFITNIVELLTFHGSTTSLFINLFFSKSEVFHFFCFCTYRSRAGARLYSFTPQQSKLRISWKTAKSLNIFVNS